METNQQIIKNLISLVHLDIDAVHAYEHAIERIDISDVKKQLAAFKIDHERHVEDLSLAIRQLGGEAPKFEADFKGFLIKGMTALRSVTGTEGALKAMKMNEELTNRTYDRALTWELPTDVKDTVENNRDDERRHLQYIESAIQNKVWERKEKAA